MTFAHTLGLMPVRTDTRLSQLLRRALGETDHTQASLGRLIGKHQTWISAYLLATPGKTLRRMFAEEPDKLEVIVRELKLDRAHILNLAGVTLPESNAAEVSLEREILVFPAGAGPALDGAEAVDVINVPIRNGGSYKVIGLRVHGDSMTPYLDDGETAIIALEPALARPGSKVGVYIPEVGSVVKELVRVEASGEYLLRSLNATRGAEYFTAPPDSRVYGPVIQRIKNS